MHRYNLLPGASEIGLGLSRIIDSARNPAVHGGPTPKVIHGADMISVLQTQMDFIDFDLVSPPIKAIPLITCASVIMGSMDPHAALRGVVYHALAGDIRLPTIAAMHHGIGGGPVESLLALYVVPKPWDDNYQNDALNLERYGIPPDNVAYIADLPYSTFGMNSFGQVGF